jgi:hypothetical protein
VELMRKAKVKPPDSETKSDTNNENYQQLTHRKFFQK